MNWQTNYRGIEYRLTETGKLHPIAEQECAWQQHDYPVVMIRRSGKQSFNESSETNSTH